MVHESFGKFWVKLGEEHRTPFVADPKTSFEKVHASVAARIKGGGLGADGKAYAGKVKDADLAARGVGLSELEAGLRWKDDEVKPVDPPAKKASSFLDFFVKAIGGG